MRIRNEEGFTLLETMIAIAIMLVAFASILMVESASINTSMKSKQLNIVAMLARRAMVEAESEFQGSAFNEVKEEETGTFEPPYETFGWKREVKEVEFPNLSATGGGEENQNGSGSGSGTDKMTETMTKLVTNYLSEAIREVTVTVSWQKGEGIQTYSVSTYWVNLNNEFSLSQR